jgi:hypothetical protein
VLYCGYCVSIGCVYLVRFHWVLYCGYWMCVSCKVSLSALWRVIGAYWMCVSGKVSLSFYGGYWVSIGCVYWVMFR